MKYFRNNFYIVIVGISLSCCSQEQLINAEVSKIDAILYRDGYLIVTEISLKLNQTEEATVDPENAFIIYEDNSYNPYNLPIEGYKIKKGLNVLILKFLIKDQDLNETTLKNFIESSSLKLTINERIYQVRRTATTLINFHVEDDII